MIDFKIHQCDTAPHGSQSLLKEVDTELGMIPSLLGVLAESPQALEAYRSLTKLFNQSSLSIIERHVVWLTVSSFHKCHYCVPAHSMMAVLDGVDKEVVQQIRDGESLEDARLESLRIFTHKLVENKGHVDEGVTNDLLKHGFTHQNVLDVVLGVVHKVMSNFTNAIAKTPVDEPFVPYIDINKSTES